MQNTDIFHRFGTRDVVRLVGCIIASELRCCIGRLLSLCCI